MKIDKKDTHNFVAYRFIELEQFRLHGGHVSLFESYIFYDWQSLG